MSGFELVKRVRALRPGIEVVVMTGYAPGAFNNEEILDTNLAFIEKPFSAESLFRAIRARLDQRNE